MQTIEYFLVTVTAENTLEEIIARHEITGNFYFYDDDKMEEFKEALVETFETLYENSAVSVISNLDEI